MTVSNINPAASAVLVVGDSFSFDLDDGGVTPSVIQVSIEGVATTVAYTLASGFGSGYTGTAVKVGNVYTITVAKDAGWDASPFTVNVDFTISGTPTTTSWSYTLQDQVDFPTLMQPRNPVTGSVSDPDAIHDNVAAEISPLALVTAAAGDHVLIEDASDSNNKKRVAASDFLGGSSLEVEVDGVSASTEATLLNFVSPLVTTEPTANEFDITSNARNHSLTSHSGGGTCELLFQADGDATDDTGTHTFTPVNTPLFGAGFVPGTQSVSGQPANGIYYYTTAGTDHRKTTGDAFSVYGMFLESSRNTNTTPYLFISGETGLAVKEYSLVLVGDLIHYNDSGVGGLMDTGVPMPQDTWCHLGLTRDASDIVKVYLNGKLIFTSGAHTAPASSASSAFCVGAAFSNANGYSRYGYQQSVKLVNNVLTDAQMLEECRRMFGR